MVSAQEPPPLISNDPKTISAEALTYFAKARENSMPQRYAPRDGETWAVLRAEGKFRSTHSSQNLEPGI
jgi:hypothetical protein